MDRKRCGVGKRKKLVMYGIGWVDVEINRLVKADWNYKEGDEETARKLTNNIKRNGQVESIIIRELDTGFYEVVNGNHRLDSFLELDIKTVHCYNMGRIGLAQAERLAIETNETSFPADQIKLSKLIKDIGQEFDVGELAETMPWSLEELDNMEKLVDFDWDQFEGDEGSGEGDLVVDLTMGSGSTPVACSNTGRDFIGIEQDERYFNIAEIRVKYYGFQQGER